MTKRIITGALLLGCLIIPSAAQQTKMLTADKHNEYGLVYTLPTTALRFEVTARRTVSKAGPFYQYAKRFIGTDKVITEDSEQWEILSVKAETYGIPDTENEYLMQVKPGALTSICVGEDGMLLAINKEVDAPKAAISERETKRKKESPLDTEAYLKYVNEDFLISQSSAKQAQMLAESIVEVRDARVSLTRGTAETMPTDGRQLELMLNSLEDQEKILTAAFKGLSSTETVTRVYTFTPDEEGKYILFRMSDFGGFVEADDYSGEPVYVTVEVTRQPEIPVDAKGKEKELPKDAVIYNIPGAAKITLSHKGRELWSEETDCSQYGIRFGLQPTLFSDKKARSYAIFDTATGALEKIAEINE